MSGFQPLSITAVSASTPVGDTASQTAASIRAGLSGLKRHAYFEARGKDAEWDRRTPLMAAPVPSMDPLRNGPVRLVDLLVPVLSALSSQAKLLRAELPRTALLVGLPEMDPAVATWGLAGEFFPNFCKRAGVSFGLTRLSQAGRAGPLELLETASELLSRREVDACVLAGVDSYLSHDRLTHLDEAYRIKSPRNVDGFVPGEAAFAMLLESPRRPRQGKPRALATVSALGLGREPETTSSDRPSSGVGLASALRAVTRKDGTPWVLCDLNGESYKAFEWGVMLSRLGERLQGIERLAHPAQSHGDIGAATFGVLAAAVTSAFERGYAPADEAVIWAGADGPLRAAARLSRAGVDEG